MARTEECILYRNFDNGEVLDTMTSLMNSYEAGEEGFENRKEEFFHMAGSLVEMAGMYGFSGNLWHTYLTQLLVNHENAFSTASEIRGQWREALTIWLFMILEFSKNFMTLILLFLTVRLEQTVLIFSVIM